MNKKTMACEEYNFFDLTISYAKRREHEKISDIITILIMKFQYTKPFFTAL